MICLSDKSDNFVRLSSELIYIPKKIKYHVGKETKSRDSSIKITERKTS